VNRIWLFALLFSSSVAVHAGEPSHPVTTLKNAGAPRPFWVSAAAAVEAAGKVRWDLFDPHVRRRIEFQADLQRRRATAESAGDADAPCSVATISVTHLPAGRPYGTWRDLVSNAEAVFLGKIVAADVGLEGATVQTLLTIEVERVLRSHPAYHGGDSYYVLVPAGTVAMAGARLCNTALNGFTPRVGDRALVMAYGAPIDVTGKFLITRDQNVIFEHNGTVIVPDSLKNDHTFPSPLSFEALTRDLESRPLERSPREEKRP
jgi:hypothetical protein